MKILCVGRNYKEHVSELNNTMPTEPVIFMKPDSALLRNNDPFYIPSFAHSFHYEVELVIRINRLGKNIEEKFAHRYYGEVGLGIDFTARDLQESLCQQGLPWERAKAFDGSAVISGFVPITNYVDVNSLNFSLLVNGEKRQDGNSKNMLFSFDEIISYVSKFFTLKIGDLIYTGTPAGVGEVQQGDRLQGFIENDCFLDFLVK